MIMIIPFVIDIIHEYGVPLRQCILAVLPEEHLIIIMVVIYYYRYRFSCYFQNGTGGKLSRAPANAGNVTGSPACD